MASKLPAGFFGEDDDDKPRMKLPSGHIVPQQRPSQPPGPRGAPVKATGPLPRATADYSHLIEADTSSLVHKEPPKPTKVPPMPKKYRPYSVEDEDEPTLVVLDPAAIGLKPEEPAEVEDEEEDEDGMKAAMGFSGFGDQKVTKERLSANQLKAKIVETRRQPQ